MIHPDTILTRYLTKSKFLSLLKDGLYLSKVTKFPDDLEGILPFITKDSDNILLNKVTIRQALEWVYVSCWYKGENEDPAMWKEYGIDNEAVAIQTSAYNLQRLFLSENRQVQSFFDYISYKDPDIESFKKHEPVTVLTHFLANEGYPQLIFSSLFSFYKHIKYQKENEVRLAVIDSNATPKTDNLKNGKQLVILKPDVFINKIIVCPSSSRGYKEEIQSLLELKKLKIKAEDSSIKTIS